jgi:hypothetical protein
MDLKDAGTRRFLMGAVTLLTPVLNRKLSLGLTPDEVQLAVEAGLGYLLMSNTKEAVVARAQAKGNATAAAVVPGAATDAKFEALTKPEDGNAEVTK